jgi:hypothetical protein
MTDEAPGSETPLEIALGPLIAAQNAARDASTAVLAQNVVLIEEAQTQSLYQLRKAIAQETIATNSGQTILEIKALRLAMDYQTSELHEMIEMMQAAHEQFRYVLTILIEINRIRAQGINTKEQHDRLNGLIDDMAQLGFETVETEEVTLRKRLLTLNRTLNDLRLKEARYGIETPTYVTLEIEDYEKRIERAQKELDNLLAERVKKQSPLASAP